MDGVPRSGEDLLDRLCGELNFTHSLISEGNEMRALTLGALARCAAVLDEVASSRLQRARLRTGHAGLYTSASRAGVSAVRARHLYAALAATPIEKPRPSAS